MIFYARSAALLPLLVPQGMWVRRTVPKLPEPVGDREGRSGKGPALRLLIVGDSAAAGVGTRHQDEALAGRLVHELGSEFDLAWQLHATSGHTTRDTLDRLEKLPAAPFDIAVSSLGVNDTISMTSIRAFRQRQARLRDVLHEKFVAGTIIVSGLPPLHAFPALPQPLRWHFGARASQLDRVLAEDVSHDPRARFVDLRFSSDVSQMASDGFHPGPGVYAEWARRTADVIRRSRL